MAEREDFSAEFFDLLIPAEDQSEDENNKRRETFYTYALNFLAQKNISHIWCKHSDIMAELFVFLQFLDADPPISPILSTLDYKINCDLLRCKNCIYRYHKESKKIFCT